MKELKKAQDEASTFYRRRRRHSWRFYRDSLSPRPSLRRRWRKYLIKLTNESHNGAREMRVEWLIATVKARHFEQLRMLFFLLRDFPIQRDECSLVNSLWSYMSSIRRTMFNFVDSPRASCTTSCCLPFNIVSTLSPRPPVLRFEHFTSKLNLQLRD